MDSHRPKPIVLIIMDGIGVAPPGAGNAVTLAKTPNLDKLWPANPHCYLHASGSAVGLPHGTNGNSEVGHINMGAGKVVFQELPRIDNAITTQAFYQNSELLKAANHIKQNNSKLHIMGLVSAGNVHSSLQHMFALVRFCELQGLTGNQVVFHAFTDGRDTPPKSAEIYLDQLQGECERRKIGKIASLCGRYYAMDRDERWDRTQKAYDMITKGAGKKVQSWRQALKDGYTNGQTDEFLEPYVVTDASGNPSAVVKQGDAVIYSNYRGDRAIQLSASFVIPNFEGWQRGPPIPNLVFVGLTQYEKHLPILAAFPPEDVKMPLGRMIAERGMRQLRIAESEKFPHVTYFFNGGREEIFQAEDRIEIPSPKVATYDQKPEMSAREVTSTLLEKISQNVYDFILVNYANGDMVGHTGVIAGGIKAVEVVDECVGKVVTAVKALGGNTFITADHGNVEEMINLQTGGVDTEHSTNPVPFIYVDHQGRSRELQLGILADIAPTILSIMDLEKPSEMTGRNLLA